MIAIKGHTQSWGCFRSRRAWRWQLIENANTQADEWEECWVCTAWKDYPLHFTRLRGGWRAFYSFGEEIKPIGYEASPCRWGKHVVCWDSVIVRTSGADTIRSWLDNNRSWKNALFSLHLQLRKKRNSYCIFYLYNHREAPSLPVYQSDAAFLWSVTLLLLPPPNCSQTLLSVCEVLGYLKSTTLIIKIDRRARADRQMDTQAEPLCAVVLTTGGEQHPESGWRWRHEKGQTEKAFLNPANTHVNM